MYGYLVYLTRDRSLAEDLDRGHVREGAAALAALRSAARQRPHLALPDRPHDRARLVPRRGAAAAARGARRAAGARDAAFAEGLSPELEAALRELSAGEREVIALRVLLELDGEEAARVLGISPTAVSTRLSRALKKLEEKVSVHV